MKDIALCNAVLFPTVSKCSRVNCHAHTLPTKEKCQGNGNNSTEVSMLHFCDLQTYGVQVSPANAVLSFQSLTAALLSPLTEAQGLLCYITFQDFNAAEILTDIAMFPGLRPS